MPPVEQWSAEGNHEAHITFHQMVNAAVGGDQNAAEEIRLQVNADPAPLIEAMGNVSLAAEAVANSAQNIYRWSTTPRAGRAGGRIYGGGISVDPGVTSATFINSRFIGDIPTAGELNDAVEDARTPSPRLPEPERRIYPLLPAATVMSQARPQEDDLEYDDVEDADPLTEFRWGEHPGPRVRRYDTEDMTAEQRDDLIQFANQWSRLTQWGIDNGFINLSPIDIHMGYFINTSSRLLHFVPVEPVTPDPVNRLDSELDALLTDDGF